MKLILKSKLAISLLIAACAFSCACSKKLKKAKPRHLHLCLAQPVRSLDPHVGTESPSVHVIKMLYEGLMIRSQDGELKEGVVDFYDISADEKTYTFYLKPTKWSNEDPVTAYDFEYSWKKAVRSPYYGAMLFSPIKNADLCSEGKLSAEALGVRALDEKTFQVTLERPTPYFLELTACINFSPIHQKEKNVTNGPFVLEKWHIGKSLTLKKNHHYWDANKVELPGVHIRIIFDQAVRHEFFKKGMLDWMGDPLSPLSFDAIQSGHLEDQVESAPINGMDWLVINTKKYPFNNRNLRKALSYAISRGEIAENLLTGSKLPARGLIHKGKNNYIRDGDLEHAQLLFNSALVELGLTKESFPEIVLSYFPALYQPCIMHMIQNQWKKTFGIRVKLDPVAKAHLYERILKGNFQVGSMFWVSIIHDPIYVLDFFRGHTNTSGWTCPFYKKLLEEADQEVSLKRRSELLEKAEAYIMDEMPVIPICFASALYMKQKTIDNMGVSPFMDVDVKHITLREE